MLSLWEACLQLESPPLQLTIGHRYIENNYISHNYVDHAYIGHEDRAHKHYIGCSYIGHTHMGHDYTGHACVACSYTYVGIKLPHGLYSYCLGSI